VEQALSLFGVSVLSALVPLVNLEVYLVGLGAIASPGHVWLLALIAGVGQMVGKTAWYFLGANALRWGWIRRKVEKPKAQAKLELWRTRTQDRPLWSALLVFVSGFSGFPPFAIVAVLAGQLRMNLGIFLVVGVASRSLRFAAFLGGAGWLGSAIPGLH
jgi:membrane protein YqaA with SNARE-associated domain